MKATKHLSIAFLAAVVLGLPSAVIAAPQTKTPFTATEVDTLASWGQWLTDGVGFYISGMSLNFEWTSLDSRISGTGNMVGSAIWDMNMAGPFWGSFQMANAGGTWTGYWQGTESITGGHLLSSLIITGVGGGGYKGLVVRMTGTDVDMSGPAWTGYIVKGGPGDLPVRVHSSRVDQLQIVPGVYFDPRTFSPVLDENGDYVTGAIGLMNVVSGVGEATHVGRETETGCGLIDLSTFSSSAMGTCVIANGDLLHWVASSSAGPNNTTTVDVHYVGGTGLMDDATGGFTTTFTETLTPPLGTSMVYQGTFDFIGEGTIRYSAPATVRK